MNPELNLKRPVRRTVYFFNLTGPWEGTFSAYSSVLDTIRTEHDIRLSQLFQCDVAKDSALKPKQQDNVIKCGVY